MRILITGAAGFLGSHLTERFLADGHEVVGVDNFATGLRMNLARAQKLPGFRLIEHDVSIPFAVESKLDGVLHLASPASPADYVEMPIQTLKAGGPGTHNTLGIALRHGARYLLASTAEVYGDPEVHPQREDYRGNVNPVGPRSVYDEAKRYAEATTTAYHRVHGLEVRIARIFNTYGPRLRPADGRVVSNFIVQVLRGLPLTVHGDGSQTRSFCYVDDQVEGLVRLFRQGGPHPVNIGNPRECTIRELAEAIGRETGARVSLEYGPLPDDDPRRRCPEIGLARRELGWEPVVDLAEGLRKTVSWFRDLLELEGSPGGREGDLSDPEGR